MGGNRLDAFVVRSPAHVLTGETPDDVDPPTVAITGPKPGAGVSGRQRDSYGGRHVGVVGVQFQLDGVDPRRRHECVALGGVGRLPARRDGTR
jgi:hypothetical protein